MRQLLAVSSVLLLSLSLSLSLAGQQWQRLPSSAHPPRDGFVAMAYDPVRERIVCVAVEEVAPGPFPPLTTTWEWDGVRWLQRRTALMPAGFVAPIAAAFDPTRGRVVLVSGAGETWSFDGIDWQLEPIVPPLPLPWNPPPWNSCRPSLAFDATRGVLVLAAYASQSGHGIYEVLNGAWTFRASLAPAVNGTVIGFDPVSGRILGFGGFSTTAPLSLSTTWAWDGTALTTLAPSTVPAGREGHVLVNDPNTGQLVMIGGVSWQTNAALADVHTWNGANWVAQPGLPAPRWRAAAAPLGPNLWLFGGDLDAHLPSYSHELLSRAPGGGWTTHPMTVGGASAQHDPARARTVSLDNGRTLEFDGYRWIDVGIAFPGTAYAALGYHAATARIVAFDQAGVTWLYDGIAWTQAVTAVAPSPRNANGLAYDAVRGVLVLVGGLGPAGALSDVWEWNGIAWTNPQPPSSPLAGAIALAWNGQYVFGVSDGPVIGTWITCAWNGTTWTQVATDNGYFTNRRLALDSLGLILVHSPALPGGGADWSMRFIGGGTWQPTGVHGGLVDQRSSGAGSLVWDANRGQLLLHSIGHQRDFVFTAQAAIEQPYGAGCSGTLVSPRLIAPVLPQLGATSISDVHRATASSFAFLLADLVQANVPLPGGCTVLLANPIVLAGAPTNGAGFAAMAFAVPPAPALRGIDVFEQALVLDPTGALFGFANLTNGLRLRIGD